MARVEWTRQSGDEVEAVVAMLVCRQFPNAVRVRPSQGDGGIDVFVPGPAGWNNERAVYQVKRYCNNLSNTEKRAIKRSYNRVVESSMREGWRVSEWHLVMPLDPTDHNLSWLSQVTQDAEFACEIKGLVWCDSMAAAYPAVVDYYLRDGKDRLEAQMNNLTAILSGRRNRQENDPLAPGDVVGDLASIHRALNACDPFYRYDYAVSDDPPPLEPAQGSGGLVAACAIKQDAVWITITIYARSLAAIEERPISAQFRLTVPADDDALREQVQRFIDYGVPLEMPPGTVSGSLDLPAGLGGDLGSTASMRIIPLVNSVDEEQTELKLAMLAPDTDAVLATTTIRRTDYSIGHAGGFRTMWADSGDLITIEMLTQGSNVTMRLQVDYELAGRRPAEVLDSLRFLAAMHSPNRFGLGRTYGPADFSVAGVASGGPDESAELWVVVADALVRIQEHVPVLLRMPAEMTEKQAGDIIDAAKLLSGETLSGRLSGVLTAHRFDEMDWQLDRRTNEIYEFVVVNATTITLGGDVIPVGKQALFFHGTYLDISDESSTIQAVSDGVCVRYMGETEVGRVLTRPVQAEALREVDER